MKMPIRFMKYMSVLIAGFVLALSLEQYAVDTDALTSLVGDGSCNTKVVTINGAISTYSGQMNYQDASGHMVEVVAADADRVNNELDLAENDARIKGVIISIDSPGGGVVAADEISARLKQFNKPNVALIRTQGASAAYWIASAAKHIVASRSSEVGSIGVTASYLEQSHKNTMEGYTFESISTGKYKDMMSENKPLTADERKEIESEIGLMLDHFIDTVKNNRNLSEAVVESLRSARIVLGEEAVKLGLIDEIGGMREAQRYLTGQMGEAVVICADSTATNYASS